METQIQKINMKRLIILFIAIFLAFNLNAQIKGVDFSKSVPLSLGLSDETLIKHNEGYYYLYASTPVGLKHAMDKIKKLLSDNNNTFATPYLKSEIIPDWVDGLTDYSNLSIAISVDEAEVKYYWFVNDWIMGLVLSKDIRTILFTKRY